MSRCDPKRRRSVRLSFSLPALAKPLPASSCLSRETKSSLPLCQSKRCPAGMSSTPSPALRAAPEPEPEPPPPPPPPPPSVTPNASMPSGVLCSVSGVVWPNRRSVVLTEKWLVSRSCGCWISQLSSHLQRKHEGGSTLAVTRR
eukprot:6213608-Pleurochrysis_carterae.AAC.6